MRMQSWWWMRGYARGYAGGYDRCIQTNQSLKEDSCQPEA